MRVLAAADLHGYLPKVEEPADLMVLAGDLVPLKRQDNPQASAHWLDTRFRRWLEALPVEHVVAVAGNHDFLFLQPELVPDLPWTYLRDEGTEVAGLRIYGSPWTPEDAGWAFEAKRDELEAVFSLIPTGLDLLLTHCPPRGFGDRAREQFSAPGARPWQNIGSPELTRSIERARPRVHVFGHVHESGGYRLRFQRETLLVNAALLDERYAPKRAPQLIEL